LGEDIAWVADELKNVDRWFMVMPLPTGVALIAKKG